jgi:sigma-B regulation protein RsbU (phosphoserine phosphatase)
MSEALPGNYPFPEPAVSPALGRGAEETRALALLQEISQELTSILDRNELVGRIAQRVKRLANYDLFSLMLWNEETQQLEPAFNLRFGEKIEPKRCLGLGEGLCGTAAQLRQTVRVGNVHTDARYLQCGYGAGVRAELVTPLLFKGGLVGVLDLESTEYDAFTPEHERLLATLGSYIAIALENARLYEQVRCDEQRLQDDLATAREIQQQVLPQATPRIPGAEIAVASSPARELGGDFYDFLNYGEGRVALAVGDVAGKATAAALYASLAIGMLREHVIGHPCPPAEMLEMMNKRLRRPAVDGRFIALAFGVYDARARTLTLANAGFPRPLVVRGGRFEPVRVEGVPVGLLPDVRYEEKTLALEPGDAVVFASDGILESTDKNDDDFGQERLAAVVAELAARGNAQEIADGILRAADAHSSANGGASDDRTVLVLRVT